MNEPRKSCRSCWFSGMVATGADRGKDTPFRWTCALGRRPKKPPFVCLGYAPEQGRAPTVKEIQWAKEFPA